MIRLTKDKIIYVTDQYNPEYEKYVEKEVGCLYLYLNETVELSDDFTLEDLFKILEREIGILDVPFSSHLGHYPLQLYIDEIKKPRPEEGDEHVDEISYLELRRYGERWEWGEIDLFIDFSGIGKKEDDPSYAIEFTPLNELKHLPLRLNEDFEISETKVRKWTGRYFSHTCVKGKTKFSVYELISEILYEISFAGAPVERDAKIGEITKDVAELREEYGELDNEKE